MKTYKEQEKDLLQKIQNDNQVNKECSKKDCQFS